MIVKNKLTKEKLELNTYEFKRKFAKEIKDAFESYKRTILAKPSFKINNDLEEDFYFDLAWNFNHHGNSNWYIEKM